jgi:hypothetical protein
VTVDQCLAVVRVPFGQNRAHGLSAVDPHAMIARTVGVSVDQAHGAVAV